MASYLALIGRIMPTTMNISDLTAQP